MQASEAVNRESSDKKESHPTHSIIYDKRVAVVGCPIITCTEEFERYLKHKARKLVVVKRPLHVKANRGTTHGSCEVYKYSRKIREFKLPSVRVHSRLRRLAVPIAFGFHTFSALITFVFMREKYETFVGLDYVSTLIGIILKKMRKVTLVVYYSIDYFAAPCDLSFNWVSSKVFQLIDRLCISNSDVVWNASRAMIKMRRASGVVSSRGPPQIVVPFGVPLCSMGHSQRKILVYVGNVREDQGLDLVIRALPAIVKRIPEFQFRIIGSGRYIHHLKKLVRSSSMNDHVQFLGFIADKKRVDELISSATIGVALYHPESLIGRFADPSRAKRYIGCGVPVIMDRVTEFASEVERKGAGIIIDYDQRELEKTVLELLMNEEVLRTLKANVCHLASELSWERVLDDAFRKTFILTSAKDEIPL